MKQIALITLFAVIATLAGAQSTQAPPSPAVSGTAQDTPSTPTYEPSDRPLSGVQNQDIGISSESRNTLVPYFTMSTGWVSNAPRITQNNAVEGSGLTSLSGSISLLRDSRNDLTSLSYTGGGQIYTLDSSLNSQFHRFDFSQRFIAGRWTFLVADGMTYQADAFVSTPALLFPGLPNGPGGVGYKPGVSPNETIIGQNIPRINNSSSGQVTYGFSRATSLTANASYGLLHYFDAGFLNTKQLGTGAGLDHRFGRNTVGVNYNFSRFTYDNFAERFDSHSIQAMFSRVLTGRWSFQAGGGPSIVVTGFGPFSSSKVYGGGTVGFQYHRQKSDIGILYGRAVTNGAGVAPGAITDTLGLTLSRRLSRTVMANVSGGYARNSGLFDNSGFNTFNVGAGLSRDIGRYSSASLGYSLQRQTGTAYPGLTNQGVTVSFRWGVKPIVLH
jgi:hypothetical protein